MALNVIGRLVVLMETELENNHKNSPKPTCKIRKTVYSMSSYREREFQPTTTTRRLEDDQHQLQDIYGS